MNSEDRVILEQEDLGDLVSHGAACPACGETALGMPYDVLGFTVSDSLQITNFVSGFYALEMKEGRSPATRPTFLTD